MLISLGFSNRPLRHRFEVMPQAASNGLAISRSLQRGRVQFPAKEALDLRTVDDLEATLKFRRVAVLQKKEEKKTRGDGTSRTRGYDSMRTRAQVTHVVALHEGTN